MITDVLQLPRLQDPRLCAASLHVSVAGGAEDVDQNVSGRVTLVLMSERSLDATAVAELVEHAVAERRGVRTLPHPNTPVLSEPMQRWSWRLAVHASQTAEQRSLHTTQTEIWLRDEAGSSYPILCQAFSPALASIDKVLNATSTFRWAPPEQETRQGA